MSFVAIDKANLGEWARLHAMLFGHLTFEESLAECEEWFENKKEVGVLYELGGEFVGFMNLSVRNDYVNGTETSPVAFVEGIYVLPQFRGRGIGREMIAYAEEFARERGIRELASDCFVDNSDSERFHKRCGFAEIERVICFVKTVG